MSVGAGTVGGVVSYVTGDATLPRGTGPRIIAHVCNDRGSWGRGFVVAVSRRWTGPEAAYRAWHAERKTSGFRLGAVQLVPVGDSIVVANVIGQHGVRLRRPPDEPPPVRYEAIGEALATLGEKALALSASVHMPRIGCGLAGGQWELVEPLINEHLCENGISVTVYDPPQPALSPVRVSCRPCGPGGRRAAGPLGVGESAFSPAAAQNPPFAVQDREHGIGRAGHHRLGILRPGTGVGQGVGGPRGGQQPGRIGDGEVMAQPDDDVHPIGKRLIADDVVAAHGRRCRR